MSDSEANVQAPARRRERDNPNLQANFPIPSPMVCNSGDVVSNWKFFRNQYEDYEVALGLNLWRPEVRLATLRSLMGKDCRHIYENNINITADQRTSVEGTLAALETYFIPRRNVVYERYIFFTCGQEQHQSVDEYITKLQHLASTCEFGILHDELIRDRLVLGTKDSDARARMLRQERLTLISAIDICRSSETVQKQLKKINPSSSESTTTAEVNFSNSTKKKGNRPSAYPNKNSHSNSKSYGANTLARPCSYCGNKHEKDRNKCPAYGVKCSRCQKENHYSKMCKSSRQNQTYKSTKKTPRDHQHHSNMVYEDDSSDEANIFKLTSHFIGHVKTKKGKQWFINLFLYDKNSTYSGAEQKCQLDCGATCNLIGFRDLCRILQDGNPRLTPSLVKLKLYDGTTLSPKGSYTLCCKFGGKIHSLKFEVVDTEQRPLLSADTCTDLNLIQFNVANSIADQAAEALTKDDILKQFPDVFDGLGCLKGEYHIEVDPNVQPIKHHRRKVPVPIKAELRQKLEHLTKIGVLAKVTEPTEWISSMVVVKRPNKLRICLDPKDLNMAIKRSHYPLPTIEEILPQLANAKVFSVLDAKDGFWQIKLSKESSYLTTFWTPFGRYRWCRMPFGIVSASEEYQRRQHEIIEGLPGVDVIVDDLLVFGCGETIEEATKDHDKNLIGLLKRARKCNLKLNKSKIRLRLSAVPYIGHLLTSDGLRPDPNKINAILNMPKPQNAADIQRFLGFINYLAKFLPRLSDVSEPLRRLMDKDAEWSWSETHEKAFAQLKTLSTSAPLLKFYDVNQPVTIQCDASEKGLGATLLQNGQPISFASRSLTKTEQKYAQIEKECLAIVFSAERFDQYLCGRDSITVESDHKPLEVIFKRPISAAPKRLQRMLLRLQRYNLDVTFKKGKEMFIADFLSRASLPHPEITKGTPDYEIFQIHQSSRLYDEIEQSNSAECVNFTDDRLKQIQRETKQDPSLQTLSATVQSGWPDTKEDTPLSIREYWCFRETITVQNGILFKGTQIIIPKSVRPELLARIHQSHNGIESCLRRARDVMFWPNIKAEIKDLVSKCSICNEFSYNQQKETLKTHKIPDRPWSRLGMDLFTIHGDDYLVIVDYYSDYFELNKLNNTSSSAVIEKCQEHFGRHGIPDIIDTDNGPQFTALEFAHFASTYGFEHSSSSPHHSQSNGKAESAVKIAKNLIKKAKKDNQDINLSLLDWRNTPTEGMYSSPVQRLMSRRTKTQLPTAPLLLKPSVVDKVTENIEYKRQKSKFYFDKHAKDLPELSIGQQVRVKPTSIDKSKTWKLGTCVRQLSPRSYVVDINGQEYRRNRKFLRSTSEARTEPALESTREIETDNQLDLQIPLTNSSNDLKVTTPKANIRCQRRSVDSSQPSPIPINIAPEPNVCPVVVSKTRTREVRRPARFNDFVT